eukprot:g9710.t1
MVPLPMQHGGPKKVLGNGLSSTDEDELLPPPVVEGNSSGSSRRDPNGDDADRAASAYSCAGYVWAATFTHGANFVEDRYVPVTTPVMQTPIQMWTEHNGDHDDQMHSSCDQGSSESRNAQLSATVCPMVFQFGRAHRLSNNVKALCKPIAAAAGLFNSYQKGPMGSGTNRVAFRDEGKELARIVEEQPAHVYMRMPHVQDVQRESNAESVEEATKMPITLVEATDTRWLRDFMFANSFLVDGSKCKAILHRQHRKNSKAKLEMIDPEDHQITQDAFDGTPAQRPATWLGYPGEVYMAFAPLSHDLCKDYVAIARPHFDFYELLEALDRTHSKRSPFLDESGQVVAPTLKNMRTYLDPAATSNSTYTTIELSRLLSARRVLIWKIILHRTAAVAGLTEYRRAMAAVLFQRIVQCALFDEWDLQFGLLEGVVRRHVVVSRPAALRIERFYSEKLPVNAKRFLRCVHEFDYDPRVVGIMGQFVKRVISCLPLLEKLTESQFQSNKLNNEKRAATESCFASKQLDRIHHFEKHKKYHAPLPLPEQHCAAPILHTEMDALLTNAAWVGASEPEIRMHMSEKASERVGNRRRDAAFAELCTDIKDQQQQAYQRRRFGNNNNKKVSNVKNASNMVQLVSSGPAQHKAEHLGYRGAEAMALLKDFPDEDELTAEGMAWVRSLSKRMMSERQLPRRLREDPVNAHQFLRHRQSGQIRKNTGWLKELHVGHTLSPLANGWQGIDPETEETTEFVGGWCARYQLYDGEVERRTGDIVFGEVCRFLHDRWIDPEDFGLEVFQDFSIPAQIGGIHLLCGGPAAGHVEDELLKRIPQSIRTNLYSRLAKYETKVQRRAFVTAFAVCWRAGKWSGAQATQTLSGSGGLQWWVEVEKKALSSSVRVGGPGKGAGKNKVGGQHEEKMSRRAPDFGKGMKMRIHWLGKNVHPRTGEPVPYKARLVKMHPTIEVTGANVEQKMRTELLPYALREFELRSDADCILTDDANKRRLEIPQKAFDESGQMAAADDDEDGEEDDEDAAEMDGGADSDGDDDEDDDDDDGSEQSDGHEDEDHDEDAGEDDQDHGADPGGDDDAGSTEQSESWEECPVLGWVRTKASASNSKKGGSSSLLGGSCLGSGKSSAAASSSSRPAAALATGTSRSRAGPTGKQTGGCLGRDDASDSKNKTSSSSSSRSAGAAAGAAKKKSAGGAGGASSSNAKPQFYKGKRVTFNIEGALAGLKMKKMAMKSAAATGASTSTNMKRKQGGSAGISMQKQTASRAPWTMATCCSRMNNKTTTITTTTVADRQHRSSSVKMAIILSPNSAGAAEAQRPRRISSGAQQGQALPLVELGLLLPGRVADEWVAAAAAGDE